MPHLLALPATEERPLVDLGLLRGRPLISVEECGALLGRSRSAAYEDARRGQIPTVQFGGRLQVPVPELLRLLGFSDSTIQGLFFAAEGGGTPAQDDFGELVSSIA